LTSIWIATASPREDRLSIIVSDGETEGISSQDNIHSLNQITKKPESHSGFLSFSFYKNIAVNPHHIANENTKISTH